MTIDSCQPRDRREPWRRLLVPTLVGLILTGPLAGPARAQEEARQVVAKAIRAAGGRKALAPFKARTWKEQAVFHGADGDERYEASYSAKWPDKIRVDTADYTLVVDGHKGWVRTGNQTRDMTDAELEEHAEGIYSVWVFSLLPLTSDDFQLSSVADTTVAGRPAAGINVRHEGHGDIQMYFDKRTGLLTMGRTRYKEARSGKEVTQETMFAEYRMAAGRKTPTKISIQRDGRLVVDSTVETTYLTELDERIFARP